MIRRACCSRMLTITTIVIKARVKWLWFLFDLFLFLCLLSFWEERHIQIQIENILSREILLEIEK